MTIVRWNHNRPATRELATLENEMNRLFDGFWSRPSAVRGDLAATYAPPVDVEETAEEFIFRADLPGVSQKDVKVSIMGDTLTIRGERRHESEKREGTAHRVERVYGSFERSFTLGTAVSADKVKAAYRDGVLEIRAPKAEQARPRDIEVQLG